MTEAGVWRDALELPGALAATAAGADGAGAVAAQLTAPGVRRVVATGNGASLYVAQALWLAALEGPPAPVELAAVPAGLLAGGAFPWREGDALLAVSSSGELRDVVEAVEAPGAPRPFALITATPESTLGRAADALALVAVPEQRGDTHIQGYCGALLLALVVWARITGDRTLAAALDAAPAAVATSVERAAGWAPGAAAGLPPLAAGVAMGSGPASAAALEAALLLKEIALLPTEGVETREGATTAMYALAPSHLVLTLPTGPDRLLDEAESVCAGRGAHVRRAPTADLGDRRIAALTAFAAPLALAVALAERAGLDPDHPAWKAAYLATARRAGG